MMRSFGRMATVTATLKRPPDIAGGQRGEPVPVDGWTAEVLPLMPVDAHTQQVAGLDTPVGVLQTFAQGDIDIRAGDVLVVDGVEYPVRWVEYWPFEAVTTVQIVVEEVRL